MTDVQAILKEIRGTRTTPEWADALGISRQAVWQWFRLQEPKQPGGAGLLALERDATPEQYRRLLAAMRDQRAGAIAVAGD